MKSRKSIAGARTSLIMLLALAQAVFPLTAAFADDGEVRIGGSPVFKIVGPASGRSERVTKVQKNIDNSLVASSDLSPAAVKVTYVNGAPVLTLGGYYIATVDSATARAAGTTPALLAQKWAVALKSAMANETSINSYVAQLTGKEIAPLALPAASDIASTPSVDYAAASATPDSLLSTPESPMPDTAPAYVPAAAQTAWQPMPSSPSYPSAAVPAYQPAVPSSYQQPYQGRVVYIPAGMTFPVKLASSLSSQVAKPGDVIMARTLESISLANGVIPANTTLIGQVTEAAGGTWLARSGSLGIKFTTLRLPNGVDTPIYAHITGKVGKYADNAADTFRGENAMSKVKKSLVATAVGAGGGAALGVAVGAIASGKRGAGRGAWSGTAMGAGVGLAESLLVRKGADVNMGQGDTVTLQLDAPVTTAMN
jgi:hypothetical protein